MARSASNIWGANLSLTPARTKERNPWQHATIQGWNKIIFSLFLAVFSLFKNITIVCKDFVYAITYLAFSLTLSRVGTLRFCFANSLLASDLNQPTACFFFKAHQHITSTSSAMFASFHVLCSLLSHHYCSSRWFLRWFILSIPPRVSPLLKFLPVFFFAFFVQRALSLVFYSLQVSPPFCPTALVRDENCSTLPPIFFSLSSYEW